MDKKWEIRKVSTPERIFSKISEEMPRPVSILLFGADCEFKRGRKRSAEWATGYEGISWRAQHS